jgi:hypothetical protein
MKEGVDLLAVFGGMSGVFQYAVLVHADGAEHPFGGRFPPTKEITLFD